MGEKNFVVSFNASDDNVNSVLSGYNRQIMEIMILVNKCENYNIAQNRKTTIIYEYITKNKRDIEYIIYIYGFESALTKYQKRFEGINSNVSVLIKDLAIMIIDEIVCIYEVQKEEAEKYPEYHHPYIEPYNIKRERSKSFGSAESAISASSSVDNSLQFNMDVREEYNTIVGNMISENSNY